MAEEQPQLHLAAKESATHRGKQQDRSHSSPNTRRDGGAATHATAAHLLRDASSPILRRRLQLIQPGTEQQGYSRVSQMVNAGLERSERWRRESLDLSTSIELDLRAKAAAEEEARLRTEAARRRSEAAVPPQHARPQTTELEMRRLLLATPRSTTTSGSLDIYSAQRAVVVDAPYVVSLGVGGRQHSGHTKSGAEERMERCEEQLMLEATVPLGVAAGEYVTFHTVDGETMEVAVPEGVAPGDTFLIVVVC